MHFGNMYIIYFEAHFPYMGKSPPLFKKKKKGGGGKLLCSGKIPSNPNF
jgi:hypothetical protein